MNELNFYKDLEPLKLSVAQVFHEEFFYAVPSTWYIVIADVKNSTEAVNAGKHNDVNLVAAGSLVAALNIAKSYKADIPFFFGGDGSTLLVPEQLLHKVLAGISAHNHNTIKNFGLELHIGSLSMKEIYAAGHSVKIAKLEIDSALNKAVIIGGGLKFAEQKIKSLLSGTQTTGNRQELNLTGLECRWDKISPAAKEAENVCYLIESANTEKQLDVYTGIITKIEEIYGDLQTRNPLSAERLKPLLSFEKIRKEMRVKAGHWKPTYFLSAVIKILASKLYFKYNWRFHKVSGKEYLLQLIAHADTLTVDGRINTIICSSREKHLQFLHYLAAREEEGILIFGHHVSKESVMTCYIENHNAKHIHFVDGADGGYTEAAKEFKSKLNRIPVVS